MNNYLKIFSLSVVFLFALVSIIATQNDEEPKKAKTCNVSKQFTDPRTPPNGNTYPTEAACAAAIAVNPSPCEASGKVARVLLGRARECDAYCDTPATPSNKSCTGAVSNQDTGTASCIPEALVEEPTYWSVMCTNISLKCNCI